MVGLRADSIIPHHPPGRKCLTPGWSRATCNGNPYQYYSWELHPALNSCPADGTANDYTHDPRFMSMLRVYIDNGNGGAGTTPVDAATYTVNLIQSRIAESMTVPGSSGSACGTQSVSTIDMRSVAITIQNFGSFDINSYRKAAFSFFREPDRLIYPSQAPTISDDDKPSYELRQPWMTTALGTRNPTTGEWSGGQATQWMTDYCAALKAQLLAAGLQHVPIRFHFDMEASMFGGNMNNAIIQTMLACENDPAGRWATVPVPGFNGKTMLQLWRDAQDEYGWRVGGQYVTLASRLDAGEDANFAANRPFAMWWQRICSVASAAAMEIAAEAPIKAAWPGGNVLVSNYDYMTMDMGADTFAHRRPTKGVHVISNDFWRGGWARNNRGAYPSVVASSATPGVKPLVWQMGEGFNSHDFDAPVLYYYDNGTLAGSAAGWDDIRLHKWYEPWSVLDTVENRLLPPRETWAEVARRQHRHLLDSILATPTRAAGGVVPWIAIPNAHEIDTVETKTGIDESRRMLALLRSKDIREAILWSNKPEGPGVRGEAVHWNKFKRAEAQVYTPSYQPYEVTRGLEVYQGQTIGGDPRPLMTTLRTTTPANEVLIQSENTGEVGEIDVTEMIVVFDDIQPLVLGLDGRFLLECKVKPNVLSQAAAYPGGEAAWRSAIVGRIELWSQAEQVWHTLWSVNDTGNFGEYAFYVPDSSTRREFQLSNGVTQFDLCHYVKESLGTCHGHMTIRLTHIAPALASGFTSSYDLVQFYHIDDPVIVPGGGLGLGLGTGTLGGADFNKDGQNTVLDAVDFTAAWTDGLPAGDFNADRQVDADDVTQFMDALVGE
jgi:hypothetical protein